tara:strand:+ start:13885 stop:15393 length:1509 start_codon:yes stop_codon:yes gene_type:complete
MLKGFFKKIKEVAGDVAPFAGLAASAFGLGPLYSTLIGAGVPLLAGKGGREALAGGIGGYFGGKTFGSRFGGQVPYVSPLDILKNTPISGVGSLDAASKVTPARDLIFERFKDSLILDQFKKDNPLRYAPSALLGTGVLAGLGAFEDPAMSNLSIQDPVYDAENNPFLIKERFLQKAKDADVIGNKPGDVFDFLRKMGLINSDGNRMTFKEGEETIMGITPQKLTRVPTAEESIESANRIAQMEGQQEYEAYLKRLILESLKKGKPPRDTVIPGKAGKGNFATGGGIGDLIEPSMMGGQIGGDRVNPTGGRLVGMGAGREDLLEGEIVDPNTGQTQEILVSNNEHVIPEYTLFALGGGDTEKGQQIMDNLRAKTKPQAEAMGYDFQGAEDGSMNYAPLMAQDGIGTNDPTKNLQAMISKMMAQGKSIKEIMAIMSKLQMGMPKLKQMPMMKAMDGIGTEEVNGLKKMEMQDGSMTGDPMMQKGLGNIIDSMAKAEQMNMMST